MSSAALAGRASSSLGVQSENVLASVELRTFSALLLLHWKVTSMLPLLLSQVPFLMVFSKVALNFSFQLCSLSALFSLLIPISLCHLLFRIEPLSFFFFPPALSF